MGARDPRDEEGARWLGAVSATDIDRSTTRLGDWYVNVLFWKRQVALFASEAPPLPVLVPFARAATWIDPLPTVLLTQLEAHEAPRSFTEQALSEMELRRIAKTPSRRVLGVMNEFKYLAVVYATLGDESGLLALSVRLADTPCGPLCKGPVTPEGELAALIASERG